MNKEEAKQRVAELVGRFQSMSAVQRRRLNEEATKQGFILPLFRALGWDTDNIDEVAPEERASNGSVDYAFKIRDVPEFFLEAKPPRENLDAWAEKANSYALHRGVDWVVLTNFAELRLYYALGNASRVEQLIWKNLECAEFERYFDDLWLLSRESFESKLIDELAHKDGRLPRRVTLEQTLFAQLQDWRGRLINQLLRWHNQSHSKPLSPEQADEIVQRLFNRLIFIRSCEDRDIEPRRLWETIQDSKRASGGRGRSSQPPGQAPLFPTATAGPLVQGLHEVFAHYCEHYDSELFGKNRYDLHLVDDPDIHLDDDVLQEILEGLYQVPKRYAQYDFSLIDADIMGRVYEQYLGHVAQAVKERARQQELWRRAGGEVEDQIQLEAKRESRKAQGIYYTPKWVVDYIVQQTVGRTLRELPYAQASQLSVVDPACGSGSFLIQAYDELLRWYAQTKTAKAVEALGWNDRITILAQHIHGVDLDRQAVEIAELNLLLKALAGRNVLPVLAGNIKRGNSLISDGESEGWEKKGAFNWAQEFPAVMERGGFDVVIGNPPYVRIQSIDREEADYYRANYESAFGSFDIYVMFLERGLKLLKPGGRLGFITSGKFLKAKYGKKIRQILGRDATVESIVDLSAQKVFAEATTYPIMLVLKKGAEPKPMLYKYVRELDAESPGLDVATLPETPVDQEAITKGVWPPPVGNTKTLMEKFAECSEPLGSLSQHVFTGIQTSADRVYHLELRGELDGGLVKAYSRALGQEVEAEAALMKPLLSGRHIGRYGELHSRERLLFPYHVAGGKAELIESEEFADTYPLCWAYLLKNRETLEDRESGKMRHEKWYAYVYPKSLVLHDLRKLAIPRLVHNLEVFYDREGEFYLDNVDVGGLILKNGNDNHYLYVMALLNSRLVDWYFQQISLPFRGGFRSANRQFLEPLPIRRIESAADWQMHDSIVGKVERMLELQERLGPIRGIPTSERDDLLREVERVGREIDGLVYEMYGLTEEKRRLVAGGITEP